MLSLALYFFIFSLVTGWLAVHILSRHLETLRGSMLISYPKEHYSLTEEIFNSIERFSNQTHRNLVHFFYDFLYKMLSRFLPWFRQFTQSTEIYVHKLIATVKGKQELRNSDHNRQNSSPFIQNMREHAENQKSGSIEG